MQVAQQFHVDRPGEVVWDRLLDVPSVVQCVPGAALLEAQPDGAYRGLLKVKLGPITASFEGTAAVVFDSERHVGSIEARGVDKRGGSRASAAVQFTLTSANGGTDVSVEADIVISGTAAQFARAGLVNELAGRMMREFATCLEAKLNTATPEEAAAISADDLNGVSMLLSSTSSWVKGRLHRGGS